MSYTGKFHMPFGTITVHTVAYEPRKPGIYVNNALAIGAPADEIRLSGASTPSKNKTQSISFTRILDKDVTVNGVLQRVRATFTGSWTYPSTGGFTASEMDQMASDCDTFSSTANLTRLAGGEV